jgi:transposase-like protein
LIFQQYRDAMATHGFIVKRARTFRDEVAVFQSNVLLVQTGITDDGRRDLRIIRFGDTDAIRGQVLMGDLKGRGIRHGLDHLSGQQTKPFRTARNFVSHLHEPGSCATITHDGLSVTSELHPVKH